MKVLVLNTSYIPIGVIEWKRSLKLVFLDKADVVEHSENKTRSINKSYIVPNVIRLKNYNNTPYTHYKFCRTNIYKRDKYRCRYCNKYLKGQKNSITVDHVIPKSRGGKESWENIVTSCIECNHKKSDFTPEEAGMALIPGSTRPSYFINLAHIHPEWRKYLPIKYED